MVDFNNDTTVTRAAIDIERVLILEKRENFLFALEAHRRKKRDGTQSPTGLLGARLESLFNQLYSTLKRRLAPEDLTMIVTKLESKKYEDLIQIFYIMSDCLDQMGLTKMDSRQKVDYTDIEESNRSKGYG